MELTDLELLFISLEAYFNLFHKIYFYCISLK